MDEQVGLPGPETSRFGHWLRVILLADALLILPFLGSTTLFQIDEGRVSAVAREMVATGDWLVPRIGGEPFGCYPPLGYWLMAGSGIVFGFNGFAMRLPAALAGIGLIALAGLTARRLAGDRTGLAAALITATTPAIFLQQAMCRADMLVTFFIAAAFDRFLVIAEEGDLRARQWLLFYAAMAAGFLAKGPLAVALPALGVIGWIAVRRRWGILSDLKPWFGIPLFAALVLPWYLLVYRAAGWEFIRLNLLLENVNAFTEGFEHPAPWWFYITIGSRRLLPWILVFLLAWPVRRTRGLSVALAWTAGALLLLHVSSSKRVGYVTYACPAILVATGIVLAALWEGDGRALRRALMAVAVLVAAAAAGVVFAPIRWKGSLAEMSGLFPVLAMPAVAGAGLLFVTARKRGAATGSVVLASLMGMVILVYSALVNPAIDGEGRRMADFCRKVAERVPSGEPIYTLGPEALEGSIYFYVARPMRCASGEPGYYLGLPGQRDRLAAAGRKTEEVDSVADDHGQFYVLFRVIP